MEKAILQSKHYFNSGFGCAEAVLMAITEYKNIQSALIPRIATGFCGGMARTNGMCGAVSGGILAINLVLGRDKADESKDANYKAVQELLSNFRDMHGELSCPALTGVDLSTEAGRNEFEERNLHPVCTNFVGSAVKRVLELIEG